MPGEGGVCAWTELLEAEWLLAAVLELAGAAEVLAGAADEAGAFAAGVDADAALAEESVFFFFFFLDLVVVAEEEAAVL